MAATFSYAQAAKGISPAPASKPASGSATPAKDMASTPPPTALASVRSWADDAEHEPTTDNPTTERENESQMSSKPAKSLQSVETSSVSSPDLGALSASTVTKDDDVSSQPIASSESTWDNKSQASTSVDKTAEPAEKTSEKVKKGKNTVVKPLQEAPLPTVNIWKLRADEQKAKVTKTSPPATNGQSQGSSTKKSSSDAKESSAAGDGKYKVREEDKAVQGRKDGRTEAESKKGVKGRPLDKDTKSASTVLPPPPNRDQESWPTPETAVDEDRKKSQGKGERIEKERKDGATAGTHGKHEWVKVPYTPSVVFNTPLPNAAGSRRGGRPGGRGGAQNGGRPTNFGSNSAGQHEKDGSASTLALNGDQTQRERAEGETPGDASPKARRTGSAVSPTLKDQVPVSSGEKASNSSNPGSSEAGAPGISSVKDESQGPTHSNGHSRQFSNKPYKSRRGEFSGAGERRREGAASPPKDNASDDRRVAAEGSGEGERRGFQDGPNGHSSKHGRYGAYSGGRERTRGSGRGARGSYSNGHQFANGHSQPAQSSSSFPLGPRSPTTFNPENFFSAPQGKYRNSHRSQSMTTDPFRYPAFQPGPLIPPMPYNPYDYGMMQPMSALAYNPYSMDQYALFAMITTQVYVFNCLAWNHLLTLLREYYFSVDNLLKDMFLRKHMDSQGFVSLDFIAGFNRIKHLSTDLDMIKLVCQQSNVVEYRTGDDGQDRLRRKDGWDKWVLNMAERAETAQNEGPKELHKPAVPQLNGFDQSNLPQYPVMPTAELYGNEGTYPQTNGNHSGLPQDAAPMPTEVLPNGSTTEGESGSALSNGHPTENSTKAVSGEPDSFSDAQLQNLTVIVRKQDLSRRLALPFYASRTFSNGSIDSKYDVTGEPNEGTSRSSKSCDTGSSEW